MVDFRNIYKDVINKIYNNKTNLKLIEEFDSNDLIQSGLNQMNYMDSLSFIEQIICYNNILILLTTYGQYSLTKRYNYSSLLNIDCINDEDWEIGYDDFEQDVENKYIYVSTYIRNIELNGWCHLKILSNEFVKYLDDGGDITISEAMLKPKTRANAKDINISKFCEHVYEYWDVFKNWIVPDYMEELPNDWDNYSFMKIKFIINRMMQIE
jgi:hypothetical protein